MRKLVAATAIVLSVALVATSAQADTNTYTGTYTGTPIGAGLWVNGLADDPDLGSVVGSFGGYRFNGTEGIPASVTIVDVQSEGPFTYTVAQDLNDNGISGEAEYQEASVSGCGTGGTLGGSQFPFEEERPVFVFIRSVASVNRTTAEVKPCEGVATHGTITLTTEV